MNDKAHLETSIICIGWTPTPRRHALTPSQHRPLNATSPPPTHTPQHHPRFPLTKLGSAYETEFLVISHGGTDAADIDVNMTQRLLWSMVRMALSVKSHAHTHPSMWRMRRIHSRTCTRTPPPPQTPHTRSWHTLGAQVGSGGVQRDVRER